MLLKTVLTVCSVPTWNRAVDTKYPYSQYSACAKATRQNNLQIPNSLLCRMLAAAREARVKSVFFHFCSS